MTNAPRSPENLALVFQEVLTATVRLRANRQAVSDAESFRVQMREALRAADQEGRQKGYSDTEMRLAILAVVAFIDESVLNSHNPVFASWPRKPLQEELFGGHVAGETFFENLAGLLRASDAASVADVLEIYDLCLLLGYQGRYTLGNRGELQAFKQAIAEKMRRIRGTEPLAPNWAPPSGSEPKAKNDPMLRWLAYGAAACLALMLVLFVAFKLTLSSGVATVKDLARAEVGGTR
ncbi:MAG: DotU family type IV/VI secretion system protein [Acidobacteriaceae bacterium]|nr:DotU family type IV/VI secretion system protein [Acidobacteriaceae bacterium]